MRDAIAYIRVSTARQGRSGLGLEAQQAALARFAEAEGFKIVATYSETESDPEFATPAVSNEQPTGSIATGTFTAAKPSVLPESEIEDLADGC